MWTFLKGLSTLALLNQISFIPVSNSSKQMQILLKLPNLWDLIFPVPSTALAVSSPSSNNKCKYLCHIFKHISRVMCLLHVCPFGFLSWATS